mgnify:FL=1
MKVAIIIPTINRPDFMLRQLEFYDQMKSPHPVYISDSSNPENSEKIKNGIEKFKNLRVVYQWAPPGKDYVYNLMPLIKEKYCMQVSDDDLMIPNTVSECAEFLESHPDYATCAGKQVNFYFKQEDFSKPYGIIERQTLPMGKPIEDEGMLDRAQNFLTNPNPPFLCFVVKRVEMEKEIRNLTKHFHPLGDMFEFLILNMVVIAGKFKVLDKIGYIMQRSITRFQDHGFTKDFLLYPPFLEQWKICEEGFSKFISKRGVSEEKSLKIVRWLFMVLFANIYSTEINAPYIGQKGFLEKTATDQNKRSQLKKIRHFLSEISFLKNIYYKFYPPRDVTRPESKYYKDFKPVKDFIEKTKTP